MAQEAQAAGADGMPMGAEMPDMSGMAAESASTGPKIEEVD